MRYTARAALLTGLWILAWGELSAVNVVSGVVVASALLVAFPHVAAARVRVRPLGVARLAGHVALQLFAANFVMIREILRFRSTASPGVVRHQLREPSEHVVTVMTSVISLSPGTMTVEVNDASDAIEVHFLFLHDVETARRSLTHLEDLTRHAIQTGAR